MPFVSRNEMQQHEDCKPRMQTADSRSTRSGTSQPEGLGDMFISDKPFADFWTNCSSCPGLQPRIDDGPAAVPLLHRALTHLFRTGAVLHTTQHTGLA